MKCRTIKILLLFGIVGFLAQVVIASDLGDLSQIKDWDSPAPGIWKTSIGDLDNEIRYTDIAADKPQMEGLLALPRVNFPFNEGQIAYLMSSDNKIMVRVPAEGDEKLYGFGLQLDGINISNRVMTLNVDHWSRGGGRTHAPVPFYISSRGYGVFINTARFVKAYVRNGNRKDSPNNPPPVDRNPIPGETQPRPWRSDLSSDAVEIQIHGEGMEIIVFSGNSMLDIVSRYNLYCGGGAMPPLWGLGFWHRVHAHFGAEQTENEVKEFEENDFPLDVIGLEPGWMTKSYPCTFEWQKKRFPDPSAFVQGMLKQGIKINLWENPYLSPESRIYDNMYPLSGSHLVWLGIVPDYTLGEARKILTDQHSQDHISIGVSGYKIDEVDGYDNWLWPDHATFPSGISAEIMRQSYGLLMQNMIYNDLFKVHNTRTYGLVRASNGAASGYPFVIYSDAYRHSQYITGLSTASLCGILWTPEIRDAENDREWLNRMQTVCFSPMAMLNAWYSGKKPWSYDEVTEPVREVIKLRMRLLPYLYTAFSDYNRKGIPPVRAMILEDGFLLNDELIEGKLNSELNPYAEGKIIEQIDQFMFGPSIMVAPFYERQAIERKVQLPSGNWYDFYSGRLAGNGEMITITAKELNNKTPLFVKEGAIIPMLSQTVNNTRDAFGHPLEVRIYGRTEGNYDLYEDDGESFDYRKGKYRIRRMTVSENRKGRLDLSEEVITDESTPMFGPIQSIRFMTE